MQETVDIGAALDKGAFAPINDWNRRHIWHFGSLLTPAEILENALGAPFDPKYYLDYLEEKCREIYGV